MTARVVIARPRSLLVLAGGHASADLCQGAVPTMIPFLIAQRGLSLSATTTLLVAMTIASSVLQPLFGWLADRRASGWLMAVALACAGAGIAVAGAVDGYVPMLLAVALNGLGVAAFHPEAARRLESVDPASRATAMSVFALGGNAGFALAPMLLTPAILLAGLPGAAVVLVPALACAGLLARPGALDGLSAGTPARSEPLTPPAAGADQWGPFAWLVAIAALRSGVYFGLQAFIASYVITYLGAGQALGNTALTVMLVAGAIGTLAGGRLADRHDRRVVLAAFLLAIPPLMALLLTLRDTAAAMALVALVGFATIGNFSLTVVMGQEYLPRRPALASGITLGLAIGLGGLIAAALAPLTEHIGIPPVLWILAALPLPAAALAAMLPKPASPGSPPAVTANAGADAAAPWPAAGSHTGR